MTWQEPTTNAKLSSIRKPSEQQRGDEEPRKHEEQIDPDKSSLKQVGVKEDNRDHRHTTQPVQILARERTVYAPLSPRALAARALEHPRADESGQYKHEVDQGAQQRPAQGAATLARQTVGMHHHSLGEAIAKALTNKRA